MNYMSVPQDGYELAQYRRLPVLLASGDPEDWTAQPEATCGSLYASLTILIA